MNKWILHVRDFGKIKSADIETAPLTFLVGDNNSGKSYLMTLIYGLLNVEFYFGKYFFDRETQAYKECCRFLDDMVEQTEPGQPNTYNMTSEIRKSFEQLLNELLKKNQKKFLRELFNREMEIGDISVEFPDEFAMELKMQTLYDNEEQEERIILNARSYREVFNGYAILKGEFVENETKDFYLSYILQSMLQIGYVGYGSSKIIYLPTTRTGFLLTYKTLIGSAMQDKFNLREDDKNLLTRPNSDFLKMLSSMRIEKESKKYEDIVKFIEENIISGHIGVSDLPAHDIMYTPEGDEKQLPMYVASGVVTEVTPLLLFLKYVNMGTLLIEEPEISLHPRLQWEMSRVLIRLKNAGMPVFVTTHSDIILQHVNNMIKLQEHKNHRNMDDINYIENDLIKREDVAVYQFDVKEDNRTIVNKLSCGDYGFEAMTFYNTLKELNEQIDWIENWEE